MSVAPYAAAYVRALSVNRQLRAQVAARLAKGQAWEVEERLVVCMVDISGYSKMSAGLTFLGKMASEVITKTVGSFLSKIIDVIALYRGDIVRFLGDALLVAFSPDPDEPDLSQSVLRSLACCLHVATCCKSVDIDMTLASTSHNPDHRRDPLMAELASGNSAMSSLYLHFAITAGPMSRIILGDPAWRLDYCVQGAGLRALGVLLDNTAHGELGISSDALAELDVACRSEVERLANAKRVGGHTLLSAGAVAALTASVFRTDAGAVAGMADALVAKLFWEGDGLHRGRVIHVQAAPSDRVGLQGLTSGTIADADEADGEEFVRKRVPVTGRFPVVHSGKDDVDSRKDDVYSGYDDVNYRERGVADRSPVSGGAIAIAPQHGVGADRFAEFRSVATIFVALVFPFELDVVQKIFLSFVKALKEHKGVFLQYSGTMLAIFGLPSFSHVNNSDQSVKCMKWFVEDLQKVLDGPFTKYISISISSGEILFTKLGNDYRSEVGLLGDVIVTAARLMPIAGSKQTIVIDQETHENVKLTHATQDLGMVHLKGRANDSRIYSIDLGEAGVSAGATSTARSQFGYKQEREVLVESGLEPMLLFIFNNLQTHVLGAASSAFMLARNPTRNGSLSASSYVTSRRASMHRQSLANQKNSTQAVATLVSAAQTFLVKAGVDLALCPLLGMVSAGLAAPETALTEVMDAQARINHVKSMVANIVTAFVRDFGAVFVFDDAQWYDSHTLEVLMTLARYCPKMSKLGKLTVPVTGVDPIISAAIFAKTSGSPLFLQMIIDVLFVKVGGELIVNAEGVLSLRDDSVRVEAILTDLSAAVLFQFDRLDATFQRILRVASVFGQYFNLSNVLALDDFGINVSECVELIKDSDVYNFLVCDLPISSTSVEVSKNPGSDGVECYFRHISIMNAIYESITFEDRLAANASVGLMIENILDEDNREALLPGLEYHFTRAGNVEKTISYKEELGLLLARKSQWVESVRILESLVEYVAEINPEDLQKLSAPITPLRKALWFTRLCNAYTAIRRYPKERDAGLLALRHLETAPWPKNEKEMKLGAKAMKSRAVLNWVLTYGGKVRTKPPKRTFPQNLPTKWQDKTQLIEMEKMVLRSMTEALSTDKAYTVDEKSYLVMRYFNLLIRNNNNPTEWTTILYRLAFTSLFANPKLYDFFIRSADANDKGHDHPSYLFIKFAKSRCDVNFEHASIGFASSVAFHSGLFNTIDEVSEPFYRGSLTLKDDPVFSLAVLYAIYRVALVRGDADAISEWRQAFEPRAAVARVLSFELGASETITALGKITNADFDGALEALEEFCDVYKTLSFGPDSVDVILTVPHVIFLLFDPVRSGLPITGVGSNNVVLSSWTGENLVRVKTVVNTMADAFKALGIIRRHVVSFWIIEMLEIIHQLLDGRVSEAVRIAKKKLQSKRRAELGGFPVLKAMYHGIIAKYTGSTVDRIEHRDISFTLFKSQQCHSYLKWLDL
ncbi:hypothetical protein HK101_006261 [Irineochytrium annulatum]|nr:hypothetical protein HK101_006261 [Irineochytrium annulatum]